MRSFNNAASLSLLCLMSFPSLGFSEIQQANTTIVVTNAKQLVAAVAPNSPYTRVLVKGVIDNLTNVLLKSHLIIEGIDATSTLKAAQTVPKSDLLIVAQDDQIKNINLNVADNSGSFAVRNLNGTSVGSLLIHHVISNGGEFNISITDGSHDSVISIENSSITLNNQPATNDSVAAAIDIMAQNSSLVTVKSLAYNTINCFGALNLGIYAHAYSTATILFKKGVLNNHVITNGKQAHAIYNYANNGTILVKGGINFNQVQVSLQSNGIYNNASNEGMLDITGGINTNTINTDNSQAYGIANQAQTHATIAISATIKNNQVITTGFEATGFNNCAGQCDTNAGADPSGTIDLSQATIINNTINAQYDDTNSIANSASGTVALINYDLGSSDQVATTLINQNNLWCQTDAKPVDNYVADGGEIN